MLVGVLATQTGAQMSFYGLENFNIRIKLRSSCDFYLKVITRNKPVLFTFMSFKTYALVQHNFSFNIHFCNLELNCFAASYF